jgi:hypothetical protein
MLYLQMRLALFLFLIATASAYAGEPLSKSEWTKETAFLTAGLVDYGQTRDIKNHPGMYEQNPLLGRSPSDTRIRNYFLAAGATHIVITRLLPRDYRPAWQWGTLILEVGVVAHNYSIGLRVDF